MSVTPPLVVPILATPLGVVSLPDAEALNPALAALFTRMRTDDRALKRNPLCYSSRDDLLESQEEPVRQLLPAIFQGVNSVIEVVNDFSRGQLDSFAVEARGWFTIVEENGHVPSIQFPLTAWCGVYCVAAPEPSATRADSGLLRLYESRLGTMFADATNATMRMPYTPGHYGWRPVPGQLAVFPALLTHEIALLRSPGQLMLVTVRVRFVAPGKQGVGRW
jgi:hypothetical protein